MSNSGALSKQAAQTFASRAEVPLTTQCVCTVCVSELPPQLLSLDEVKQIYGPVLDKQVCGSGLPAHLLLRNVPFVSSLRLHITVLHRHLMAHL